ncbi:hypothetical protein Tco_1033267 [Tanacetum coccineum]|uniref:Tf2-1-like SH3-like domain-containing protein n=1 Tax=Tanacetum coccineum TaxID=301880 RepID=A0ABQ5GE83_9ASTR
MQAARYRQKRYVDLKHKPMEFQVGDKVMLKVLPWKGVVHLDKRGKIGNSRLRLRPFKVLEKVRSVAYKLELPQELNKVICYRDLDFVAFLVIWLMLNKLVLLLNYEWVDKELARHRLFGIKVLQAPDSCSCGCLCLLLRLLLYVALRFLRHLQTGLLLVFHSSLGCFLRWGLFGSCIGVLGQSKAAFGSDEYSCYSCLAYGWFQSRLLWLRAGLYSISISCSSGPPPTAVSAAVSADVSSELAAATT